MKKGIVNRALRCAFILFALAPALVRGAEDLSAVKYFKDYLDNCGTNEIRCVWFLSGNANIGMLTIFSLRDHKVTTTRNVYNWAFQNWETRNLSDSQIRGVGKIAKRMPPSNDAVEFSRAISISLWQSGRRHVFRYDRQHVPKLILRLYEFGGGYL